MPGSLLGCGYRVRKICGRCNRDGDFGLRNAALRRHDNVPLLSPKHELLRHNAPLTGNLFDWNGAFDHRNLFTVVEADPLKKYATGKLFPADAFDDEAKRAILAITRPVAARGNRFDLRRQRFSFRSQLRVVSTLG